jgi:hypothetical protein
MKTFDMWIGNNGEYRVPEAISNLGRLANERAGLPYLEIDWRNYEAWSKSPYYKIVEEWGTWRDQQ